MVHALYYIIATFVISFFVALKGAQVPPSANKIYLHCYIRLQPGLELDCKVIIVHSDFLDQPANKCLVIFGDWAILAVYKFLQFPHLLHSPFVHGILKQELPFLLPQFFNLIRKTIESPSGVRLLQQFPLQCFQLRISTLYINYHRNIDIVFYLLISDFIFLTRKDDMLKKVPKIKDFYIARLCSSTTVSTCTVPGNKSTQLTRSGTYPFPVSSSRSLARLVGLQEI